jgi:two-component system response regulator NreC
MTRVVLVDEHPLVRRGLRAMFATDAEIDIVGEAGSAGEALTLVESIHPDVVVLDLLEEPEKPGLSLTRDLKHAEPAPAVLIVTGAAEQDTLLPALEAGADGFCNKDRTAQEYVAAVHTVAAHHPYLCDCAQREILQIARQRELLPDQARLESLTGPERAVLTGIAGGYACVEIATRLGFRPARVERLQDHIKRKLHAEHRSELVDFALRVGLLNP